MISAREMLGILADSLADQAEYLAVRDEVAVADALEVRVLVDAL